MLHLKVSLRDLWARKDLGEMGISVLHNATVSAAAIRRCVSDLVWRLSDRLLLVAGACLGGAAAARGGCGVAYCRVCEPVLALISFNELGARCDEKCGLCGSLSDQFY